MNDETINVIILVMMLFAFMSIVSARRARRQQRNLQRTLDHLQTVHAPAALPAFNGASKEQVERLEDRVRVLERIVTDRGPTLAAEIEALRDKVPGAMRDTIDAPRELSRN